MLTPKLQMLDRTLRRLIRRGAAQPIERVLQKTRAADIAFLLAHFTGAERVQLLEACRNDQKRAHVLAEADADVAASVVAELSPDRAVDLLQNIEPDDASDIFEHLPEEKAAELLARMRGADRTEVEELSHYDSATAGGIMSPRFFALHRDTAAHEAIAQLQRVSNDLEMVFYVYVVNEVGQLLGVVSLRQLVTTKADTTLFSLMTSDLITVRPDEDQEEVAKLASRYGLLAVPVVDESNKLLGIVTVDDVIDVLREEATEDILRMAGAGTELDAQSGILRSFVQRFPWTMAVAVGGALGAVLLFRLTDATVASRPVILLLPLVLGLSGATGLQGATVMAQRITEGRIGGTLATHLIRQGTTGTLLGLAFGLIVAPFCWYLLPLGGLPPGFVLAHTIPLLCGAIAAAIALATTVGAVMSMLFSRIGVDPTLAAGPIGVITIELVALALYLMIAAQIA